jgi:glycerate 2-kinase
MAGPVRSGSFHGVCDVVFWKTVCCGVDLLRVRGQQLTTSSFKHDALGIFSRTIAEIDIPAVMSQKLARSGSQITVGTETIELANFDRIHAVSIGKASVQMARGLAGVLGNRAIDGMIVAPEYALEEVAGFRLFGAAHPLPNLGSLVAARKVLDLLAEANRDRSIIFFLLSGGGSSMLELPLDPNLSLSDLRVIYQLLIECGAGIEEINTVRKHLSAIKGGRLAAAAPKAMKVTLAVSDVAAGREFALASGPTLPDPTTPRDALRVIECHRLRDKMPSAVCSWLEARSDVEKFPEDGVFDRTRFAVILNEADLFSHAARAAEAEGFVAMCDNSTDDWPVNDAANYLISELSVLRARNPGQRVALIAGGELSSPVIGDGVGGRNSAFVLDCVKKIAGRNITVLSAGTDGRDGSSPAAGAVADGNTFDRATLAGLDPDQFYLESDSYHFFHALDDHIDIGPTGNNLRDFRILLTE